MKTLRLFACLYLFFAGGARVFPQSQPADAHIRGQLTDPSDAGVGGVRVTAQLENTADAAVWSATSSTDGAYDLSVPPGRYRVHFSRDTFAPRDVTVELTPGTTRVVNFRMELQALSDQVLVTAQAEPIGAQQSAAPSSIVGREEIERRQWANWGKWDGIDFSGWREFELHEGSGGRNGDQSAGRSGGFFDTDHRQFRQSGSGARGRKRDLRNGCGFRSRTTYFSSRKHRGSSVQHFFGRRQFFDVSRRRGDFRDGRAFRLRGRGFVFSDGWRIPEQRFH